jgi:hypothetical protein
MADLVLRRVSQNDFATYGVLVRDSTAFVTTLERPWKENARRESCIPAGTYLCRRVKSPKFGDTFEIVGVPDRSAILFHKGNLPTDSLGCILIGESFNPVGGKPGITSSAEGFAEFLKLQKGVNTFTLAIIDP